MNYIEALELFDAGAAIAPRTKAIYHKAIEHFIAFINSINGPALNDLGQHPQDAGLLERFALWLLNEHEGVQATSTVHTYVAGVSRWFQWLLDYGHLPQAYPLNRAKRMLKDALKNSIFEYDPAPPLPPEGIDRLIYYYDGQQMPEKLNDPAAKARWRVTNHRNRAILRVLAETGGRASEVASLNVKSFPPVAFGADVWRVPVVGKGRKGYDLRFNHALPSIKDYLIQRHGLYGGDSFPALFISHRPGKSTGDRITRNSLWHIVNYAAGKLGLGKVRVHDFRHWRATQLVNEGVPLEVVRDYLGHRSIITTERFYAKVKEARVDAAAMLPLT
jgi:integrase